MSHYQDFLSNKMVVVVVCVCVCFTFLLSFLLFQIYRVKYVGVIWFVFHVL